MKRTPKSLLRQSGDTQAFFDAKELDRMKALVHGSLTTLQGR